MFDTPANNYINIMSLPKIYIIIIRIIRYLYIIFIDITNQLLNVDDTNVNHIYHLLCNIRYTILC